jgi:hypothetical protein
MEKRREISGAKKPNAAPRADVDRVIQRIKRLNMSGVKALKAAGFSRPTWFRLKKYDASTGTVRDLEEWLLKQEVRHGDLPQPTKSEEDALLDDWNRLGEELIEFDANAFRERVAGLRKLVEGVRLQRQGLRQMFGTTPDDER